MRLVLAFSENFNFKDDDIVIFGCDLSLKKSLNKVDVNSANINNGLISEQYEEIVEKISKNLHKDLSDVFVGCNNNLFTNHLVLFKWKAVIDDLIYKNKNKIDEIVITDMIDSASYAPYYEAEGESHLKLFYEAFDFVPYVLYEYIAKHHPSVGIKVIRKRSKILRYFRIMLRREILLITKFILLTIGSLSLKLKELFYKPFEYNNKVNKILITRSVAHLEGFKNIADAYGENSIFFCGEGLFTFSHNIKSTRKVFSDARSFSAFIGFWDLLKSFMNVYKNRYASNIKLKISIEGITYSYLSAAQEMLISNFEVEVFERSLRKFLNKYKLTDSDKKIEILCAEMFTPYALSVAKIGAEFNLVTFQVQTTSMFAMCEPNYIHCDYFIFGSKTLQSSFIKMNGPNAKALFLGNYLQNQAVNTNLPSSPGGFQNITYFTQPITDEHIEQNIIDLLCNLSKELNFKFSIKLHPRDNINKVIKYRDSCTIIPATVSYDEYIKDIDLAILKTSSIASSIVLSGVPIIYCLFSEWARKGALDYIDFDYFGTCVEIESIPEKIKKFNLLKESFKEYRNRYINNNELSAGINEFILQLDELVSTK